MTDNERIKRKLIDEIFESKCELEIKDKELREKEKKLLIKQQEIHVNEKENKNIKEQLKIMSNIHQEIISTKGWKLLEKLRKLKR